MSALAIRRDTDDWREARRAYVTSTDLPIILGLSPFRVEADLAADKRGELAEDDDPKRARMFRLGQALETVIRDEDEAEHGIRLRKVKRFLVHPEIVWAATSLDFERVGERCIVEAKSSRSRRWDEGLPQDVETQVRWQMGVAGYPRAHVALLRSGSELECFDVEHDEATFTGLVKIAADFRARLAAGGPFAESADSIKRRFPGDNGAEMLADVSLAETVTTLVEARRTRKAIEADEERLETAIKSRMGDFASLRGPGFHVTWKRTKDGTATDWKAVAEAVLAPLPETERVAFVGPFVTVRPGFRPLRVTLDKEDA